MSDYADLQSSLAALGFQDGFTDLLGIVRSGNAVETVLTDQVSQLTLQNIIAASSFNLNLSQESVAQEGYAGEGPDSSVIMLGGIKVRATATFPMYAPSTGWVDPAFANLYDLVRWAYWGTPEAAVGCLTIIANIGDTVLYTDNISEFVALSVPFSINLGIRPAYNYSGSSSSSNGGLPYETIVVESVSKGICALNLASPVQYTHNPPSLISATLTTPGQGPEREPSFSLFSWREGMLSPCLINKLTIDSTIGEPVKVTVEFSALKAFRDRQIQFENKALSLTAQAATAMPSRIVDSFSTKLSLSSSLTGTYGLPTVVGDPLFGGFQSLDLDPLLVTGFSITIDNNLEEEYSLHALGSQRLRNNNYPYALVSGGRKVNGDIKLRSTLDAWGSIERLGGPSSLASGGLMIDYGVCSITLPEIGWSPISNFRSSEEPVNRTLKWTLLADERNALPDLMFSSQS